jgi:hypothetical protein
MRIRTQLDLTDKIAGQLSWRRMELAELRSLIISSADNNMRQSSLIRAGVALLYAHWEGFIKTAGSYLLEYISEQRPTHQNLQPNFIGVILSKRLSAIKNAKKISATCEVVNFLCTKMKERARIPKDAINTESNLSSLVFKDILWSLGLDEGPYLTKKHIIDDRLLDKRNHIAHGEELSVKLQDYLELHDEVIGLLDNFRTQLENSCVQKQYLRVSRSA